LFGCLAIFQILDDCWNFGCNNGIARLLELRWKGSANDFKVTNDLSLGGVFIEPSLDVSDNNCAWSAAVLSWHCYCGFGNWWLDFSSSAKSKLGAHYGGILVGENPVDDLRNTSLNDGVTSGGPLREISADDFNGSDDFLLIIAVGQPVVNVSDCFFAGVAFSSLTNLGIFARALAELGANLFWGLVFFNVLNNLGNT